MAELTVEICTHHFVCKNITPRARPAIEGFARRFIHYGLVRENGRYFRAPIKVFAAATNKRTEYRFHINALEEFKRHILLSEYLLVDALVEWVVKPIPESTPVDLSLFDFWQLRENQVPVVDYVLSKDPPLSKFVELQTGAGKSLSAMWSASKIAKRYCLIVRPAYIEKWVLDLQKTYDGDIKEHVLVVQGSAQLMRLLQMAETGELDDIKVIVFSNKTLQNWFKLYEQHGAHLTSLGYACLPHQLCEFLGIGFRVIDEVHQDFHLNFKIDLYTHVERSVSLSATLISGDDFINNMYELAYPSTQRYKGGAYDKYIEARAVLYRLSEPNKIRTTEYGSKTYSHHAFEKSVMRNPVILRNYLTLISQVIRGTYLNNYKPGDRLLVYGASIDFCTRLTAHLKQQHPTLHVNRYVESDPYDNLMESDICVSTLQSAGTGVDILGLTTVILTPAVKSSAANIQGFGRLRKLKDGTVPQFMYFVCQDIKKHVEYHASKRELLASRAAVYREEYMNSSV